VQESGGVLAPITALKRATLYEQDARYLEDKNRISSHEGMQAVQRKVLELFAEIEKLCGEIRSAGNISIRVGSNAGQCVLTNNRISLIIGWRQPYTNSRDGCSLKVVEFNMQMGLPNERLMFFSEPTALHETGFLPELSRTRELGWIEPKKPAEFLTSKALADKCVIQFLDLAGRADQGKVPPPSW
jgi:hypothetical protein